MSDTNEFLPDFDPEAVNKLNDTLNTQPLNRGMMIKTSQRTHRPKAKESNISDKEEGKRRLAEIKEEMRK